MSRPILLVVAAVMLLGCLRPDAAIPPVAKVDAGTDTAVEIRVRNATNVPFDSVMVRFADRAEQFGAVAVSGVSDYRRVARAYRYAYVEARSGEKLYVAQPIDYVGETFLRAGRYTYSLEGRFSDEPSAHASQSIRGFMRLKLNVDRHGA